MEARIVSRRATWLHGLVKYHLGEFEEAERLGLQAREWFDRTGDSHFRLQNLRTLALCSVAKSDLSLAEQQLREAIPLALEIGGRGILRSAPAARGTAAPA